MASRLSLPVQSPVSRDPFGGRVAQTHCQWFAAQIRVGHKIRQIGMHVDFVRCGIDGDEPQVEESMNIFSNQHATVLVILSFLGIGIEVCRIEDSFGRWASEGAHAAKRIY